MFTQKLAPYAMAMGILAFSGAANATVVGPLDIDPCCSEADELEFVLNNADIMAHVDDALESTIMTFGRVEFGNDDGQVDPQDVPGTFGNFELSDPTYNEDGELLTVDLNVLNIPAGFELLGVLVKDGRFGEFGQLGTFWFADMLDDIGLIASIDEFGNITYSGKAISHITAFKIASVVPLPGALVFMLTGIAGLGLIARRRQRSAV